MKALIAFHLIRETLKRCVLMISSVGILILVVSCTSVPSVQMQTTTEVSPQPAQVNAPVTEPVQDFVEVVEAENPDAEQSADGGVGNAAVISP